MQDRTISTADAARRLGVTQERVRQLCKQRRIPGARLVGRAWRLPIDFVIREGKRGPKLGR